MNASAGPPGEDGTADAGHRFGAEFRLLLDALAERAEPWLNQLATPGPGDAQQPTTCDWCPLCAAVALVRGEHSELAGRAAEHLLGLLALARAGLAAHAHHQHAHHPRHDQGHAGDPGGGPEPADAGVPREQTPDPAPPAAAAEEGADRPSRVQRITVHRRVAATATTGPATPEAE
jgi:hypothetical protein